MHAGSAKTSAPSPQGRTGATRKPESVSRGKITAQLGHLHETPDGATQPRPALAHHPPDSAIGRSRDSPGRRLWDASPVIWDLTTGRANTETFGAAGHHTDLTATEPLLPLLMKARMTHAPTRRALLLFLMLASCVPGEAQQPDVDRNRPASGPANPPNILLILSDDMGYGDLGCYGQTAFQTPNLDKLASEGIKLVNAYSAGAVCTPTRAALMTGRYPARTPVGLFEPLKPVDSAFGLTARYRPFALLLQKKGYETALIGKWHLGYLAQHSPTQNGFDFFFGLRGAAADYHSHRGVRAFRAGPPDLYENEQPVRSEAYLTDLFTQKAVDFLKQKHRKPFFLALTYNAPHWPWQGPTDGPYPDSVRFVDGGSPAVYAAMMKSLDDGIGRVMKTLDEQGLAQNTLVIFTNDNGGERYSRNGGLSKSKSWLWEGGIRVPAFVRWPGRIAPGGVTRQVAITMDWTATILAAAGAKPDPDFPPDGINLLPVLTGSKPEVGRTLCWRTFQHRKQKAIRDGNWKYLQDEEGEHLFDLSVDEAEQNDLKDRHPAVVARLKEKYARWEKPLLAPIPL